MTKNLTLRITLTFLALDVLFAPFVMLAFTQLLGAGTASEPWYLLGGLTVLKILCWSAFGNLSLAPWERLARSDSKRPSAPLVQGADRALQAFPLRFGLAYMTSWVGTYLIAYWVVRGYGAERLPLAPQSDGAIAILSLAIALGSFAFAYPLAGSLTTDAASQCSGLARSAGYGLERSPTSLQLRIAVIAIMLGLAPMLWMVALGYVKQIDSSHEQRVTRAALESAELALSLRGGEKEPRVVLEALAEQRGVDGLVLDARGLHGSERGLRPFALRTDLKPWLEREAARRTSGTHARIDLPEVVAFRRIDAERVAVTVSYTPVAPSSGFVWSAFVFTILVLIWAPVCAYALGHAVSRPIAKLTAIARRIVEQGDLKQIGTMPVASNDEIGVLTERVNDVLDLMRGVSEAAHAIARGDLRATVEGSGELPESFRGMLESLSTMVLQIRETSVDLASAATEIFAASQEQEAAATSQSSAMVEISRTMDSLSESAAHVSDAVQGVLSNAERTLHNTDDMVRRIGDLTSHANRIGEILEVIRDIADRSDLLALNGSLEASHAGEGGRGFALVASEMRRLAERVTASVSDVKKLVSDIRDSGSSTVMATEESKKLAEGTTDAARQITFVTQQQRSGTEQVSQSIKGIADVVSQAVSATTQTRSSAQGLKSQADRLSALVKRFELTTEAP
jgi:methyl-accepting chemotaxis protein